MSRQPLCQDQGKEGHLEPCRYRLRAQRDGARGPGILSFSGSSLAVTFGQRAQAVAAQENSTLLVLGTKPSRVEELFNKVSNPLWCICK